MMMKEYDAESKSYHKGKWITITENKAELTGLLSLSEIGRVIEKQAILI